MIVKYSFDPNERKERCGVIPYTIIDGEIQFMLGVDFKSGELTDFGGGAKIEERSVDCAFREFKEETHSLFCRKIYDPNFIQNKTLVSTDNMLIIFLPIMNKWYKKAKTKFYHKRKKSRYSEIYNLRWLDEQSFREKVITKHSSFYNRVLDFLYNFCCTEEFYETLRNKW